MHDFIAIDPIWTKNDQLNQAHIGRNIDLLDKMKQCISDILYMSQLSSAHDLCLFPRSDNQVAASAPGNASLNEEWRDGRGGQSGIVWYISSLSQGDKLSPLSVKPKLQPTRFYG